MIAKLAASGVLACTLLATPVARAASERVIYSFPTYQGSFSESGPLVGIGNTLYGTTSQGGSAGLGTLYSLSTAGHISILHDFQGGADGSGPNSLLAIGDTLYGTTLAGGAGCQSQGCGTLFQATAAGGVAETYAFKVLMGAHPTSLTKVGAALFGTTRGINHKRNGNVFKVAPDGHVRSFYEFQGGTDGSGPGTKLLNVGGTLYGTTYDGGADASGGPTYAGTVFKLDPSGAKTTIYSFPYSGGANEPNGSLIKVGDAFYGTTFYGGSRGSGTVFKITTGGVLSILHSFSNTPDGAYPNPGLVELGGALYGTTPDGGRLDFGGGTVFSITPAGHYAIVHSFPGRGANAAEGAAPESALTNVGGTLYGTTWWGGATDNGTVFAITP